MKRRGYIDENGNQVVCLHGGKAKDARTGKVYDIIDLPEPEVREVREIMSKEKFTPGPWDWTFSDEGGFPFVFATKGGAILAHMCVPDENQKQMIANAALIASALEMYEVIRRLAEMTDSRQFTGIRDSAKEAMRKARGEA